jgi:hypothetical protein
MSHSLYMDIEREINDLTKRVAALEAAMTDAPVPAELAPTVTPASVMPPPPPPGTAPSQPAYQPAAIPKWTPPEPPSFEWGIETVLRWAGVALVTLAGVFLVSTAISRGWIGPELQLLGAALGGSALLAAAVELSESRRPWALALGCGGSIVVAASALATHEWLDLVGPGPAVGLLAIATAGSLAVALKSRIEGIALVAGVVGMLAPIETLDNFGDGAILSWVGAFVVGSSALGLLKRWPGVRMITGWVGAFVLMVYALSEEVEGLLQVMGFVGAAIIGATLWAGPTIAKRLSPIEGSGSWRSLDWAPIDYRLVAFVPAWAWGVVAGLLPIVDDQDFGLVAIASAAGFLALAGLTLNRVERLVSISTLLGSLTVLAVGFSVYFDGPALMVALAGQAVTSHFLSRRLDDDWLRYSSYLVGGVSSVLAVVEMARALEDDGFANFGYGLATGIVVLCWIGAAVLAQGRDDLDVRYEVPLVGAWVGSMLWLAAVLIDVPQGLGLISAAWALMACAGLIIGLIGRISVVRNLALGTLGVTLAKLVTVDLAEVEVFWRVGLFFVVGMGLIALGLKVPSLIGPPPDKSPDPDQEPAEVAS